ncbi:MAG: hypothetical protein ACK5P7_07495, partial [Bdellovibrio sp.]
GWKLKCLATLFMMLLCMEARAATVEINWQRRGLDAVPQTYQTQTKNRHLVGTTQVHSSFDQLPVLGSPQVRFQVEPGVGTSVVVVLQNTGKKNLYFHVAPHQIDPPTESTGFYFECLCNSRIYAVKPGEYWSRVLRMNVNREHSKKNFKVSHMFIGVSEEDALSKYKHRIFWSDQ